MSTIHLPETIDQAIIQLTGVESLLTATEWERAAIDDSTNGSARFDADFDRLGFIWGLSCRASRRWTARFAQPLGSSAHCGASISTWLN